jgi:hypothetical protein
MRGHLTTPTSPIATRTVSVFSTQIPPNESVWVSDRKEGMGSAVFGFLASPAYLRIIPHDPVLSPVGRHTPEIQKRQEKKKIFRQKNLRARRKNGISVNSL